MYSDSLNLEDYDLRYLQKYTPCIDMTKDELVHAMALCHVEFIIIHLLKMGMDAWADYSQL